MGKKKKPQNRRGVRNSQEQRNPRRNTPHSHEKKKSKAKRRATSRRRNKRRMSSGQKITVSICFALLILVLVAIGLLASKMAKLKTEHLDVDKLSISDELELDKEGYLNVALFGLDTRDNDVEMGTRSDTIMIASLNNKTKEIKLVSVFRDTILQRSDSDYPDLHKANSAYSYGEEEEAIAMLNRNLDMDIEKYVTVDFSALVDVINALGGVEIDVTEEEVDYINGYGTEVTANTGVITDYVYHPGLQLLDGVQATSYCRIRYTTGDDFKRAERQRTVLMKVAEKAQQADLGTINKIIDKVFPKIKTNFTMPEILAYAKDVKKYQFGSTMGFPVDKNTMNFLSEGDSVIPVTLKSNVIELHEYLFESEEVYEPTSTVEFISEMIENQSGFYGVDVGESENISEDFNYVPYENEVYDSENDEIGEIDSEY